MGERRGLTRDQERYIGIGAGAVAIIAALLPWAKLTTVFGSLTKSGMDDGGDGLFTAGLGLIGGLALWQAGRWVWLALIAGGLIVVIGIYDIVDVSNLNDETGGIAHVSVGAGLYLTVVAGVVLGAVAGLQLSNRHDSSPRLGSQPPPLPGQSFPPPPPPPPNPTP